MKNPGKRGICGWSLQPSSSSWAKAAIGRSSQTEKRSERSFVGGFPFCARKVRAASDTWRLRAGPLSGGGRSAGRGSSFGRMDNSRGQGTGQGENLRKKEQLVPCSRKRSLRQDDRTGLGDTEGLPVFRVQGFYHLRHGLVFGVGEIGEALVTPRRAYPRKKSRSRPSCEAG